MRAYLWVSLGALLGANLRYFLSRIIAKLSTVDFPYGTLIINVTGSFLLGLFLIWTTERVLADPKWRLLVAIGFCGSLNTFFPLRLLVPGGFSPGPPGPFFLKIPSHQHPSFFWCFVRRGAS